MLTHIGNIVMENDDEVFNLHEAAAFLKMHWQTLREKAVRGEIPAAKPAKQWVFIKSDLVSYLRSFYSRSWLGLQVQQNGGSSLCCISDQTQSFGGANSPHQTDSEYENLLKR
ncbi:MAG TPA: DNA-binding protein [Methylophaga aminisulfidivorans]|uniref:DNA-binding protein n=1 Tax=Methylophaga aminisulfidivorans TaxID=230105 RepID=A0A7C2A5M6_9GAMM|nr:DNA-binding protein [Methylophaga aminisulfidivorans]